MHARLPEAHPLQAADLIAYEWRKRTSDKWLRPHKALRRSYIRLREGRPGLMQCYGPEQMSSMLAAVIIGHATFPEALDLVQPTED
jgi:hypothetical protein